MVTVEGAVPLMTLPVSVTSTFTVSALAGAGDTLIVNVAAVPSITGEVPAEIVTCGVGGGGGVDGVDGVERSSLSFTVTLAEDELPTV